MKHRGHGHQQNVYLMGDRSSAHTTTRRHTINVLSSSAPAADLDPAAPRQKKQFVIKFFLPLRLGITGPTKQRSAFESKWTAVAESLDDRTTELTMHPHPLKTRGRALDKGVWAYGLWAVLAVWAVGCVGCGRVGLRAHAALALCASCSRPMCLVRNAAHCSGTPAAVTGRARLHTRPRRWPRTLATQLLH